MREKILQKLQSSILIVLPKKKAETWVSLKEKDKWLSHSLLLRLR